MNYIKKEQGFTLIEVLVAFVLLAIMVTFLLGYYISGMKSVSATGSQGQDLYTAQQHLEERSNLCTTQPYNLVYSSITISGKLVKCTKGSKILTEFIPN
jgi:prepilin-type N-terminal cleavage/methylation domain-containing protein